MLCWYDEPGERLVNDLDLSLSGPGLPAPVWGNHFPGQPAVPGGPDRLNTVEVIDVDALAAGTWILSVAGERPPGGSPALRPRRQDVARGLTHHPTKEIDHGRDQAPSREDGTSARGSPQREPTTTIAVTPAPRTAAPVVPAPAAALAGLGAPAGFGAALAAADVSGQLKAVAPTFGDVLKSIGIGVADSQAALDQGVISTVNELADTNITVVTDVIQHLDDDGLPVAADTELVSTDLSVLNFFMPTVHEWKRVALSMDLSCGAFNESDGLSFNAKQSGGGVGGAGLFWGFLGVNYEYGFDNQQNGTRSHEQEASWSSGEVRIDAILGPRQTGKLPVPSQVAIGPQIVFSQGPVKETAVAGAGINRSVDVVVSVRKAGGDVNPGVSAAGRGRGAAHELLDRRPRSPATRRTRTGRCSSPSPATSRTRAPPPPASPSSPASAR